MAANRKKRVAKPSPEESRRESGLPGGGRGRKDVVGQTGVYPASGPFPSGPAELRTPAEFVHGQTDAEGRPVEGGSEVIYFQGQTLLGGMTPPSSAPTPRRKPRAASARPRRARPAKHTKEGKS